MVTDKATRYWVVATIQTQSAHKLGGFELYRGYSAI
jgi:hypothetical protein